MAFLKLLFLFVLITMMQHRGIIYRTGAKKESSRPPKSLNASIEPKSDNLLGSWRMYGVDTDDPGVIDPDRKELRDTPMSRQELFISFFPDGSFTQVRDKNDFSTGRWSYDSTYQSVFLTLNRATQEVAVRLNIAENGLRVMNFHPDNTARILLMEYGLPLSDFKEDPFYFANNTWRNKPLKPENQQQIRARLRNYILHNAYLLKAALEREHDRISWEFSAGILKIYNPGIGIVKPAQIPDSWVAGFYSREQAMEAYGILENFLAKTSVKDSGGGNWVEKNYRILEGIHKGLAK